MKKCTKCGKEKELVDFAKDSRRPDGAGSSCKSCEAERTRQRYPLVSGNRQPRQKTRKDTIRQSLVARHGLSVVDAMESIGDCSADLRDLWMLP